jgi:hypothetical protein
MLRQANRRAVLRTRLVVVIVPVVALAPAPPAVHHIIIAVTHTNIQQAQAVQLDSKTVLILNHNTKISSIFLFVLSVRL